jgi:hypothetical protein
MIELFVIGLANDIKQADVLGGCKDEGVHGRAATHSHPGRHHAELATRTERFASGRLPALARGFCAAPVDSA